MFHQCELARLCWRLENDHIEPERIGETVGELRVKSSIGGEEADPGGAFPGLDDQVARPRLQPLLALLDQIRDGVPVKGARVLFPELKLNAQPSLTGHPDNCARLGINVRKARSALDAEKSHVRAQIQIRLELALGHRNLKRTAP